jgi:hypothetical protein
VFVEDEPAVQAPIAAPPPPLPAPPAPIGFHNGAAVRVALVAWILTVAGSTLFGVASVPQVFALLWLPAGGFFAVYLYRRRTGQRLTILNGAHLGWLSGIFGFVMALIGSAVEFADPTALSKMRQQMQANGFGDANITQVFSFLTSPGGIIVLVVGLFIMFTFLPACGGALGAKLLDRD